MRRVLISFAVVTAVVAGYIGSGLAQEGQGDGQDHDRQFHHKNHRGEDVDVMPPPGLIRDKHDKVPVNAPPSNGTTVYSASYGSGNLIDHGGKEISGAAFQAIYWNSTGATSTQTSTLGGLTYPTIQGQIHAFTTAFSSPANWSKLPTNDYAIVQQYGSHATIASFLVTQPDKVDTQATTSSITDAAIQTYLKGLFNTGAFVPNASTIYGVYFPSGQKVTFPGGGASCTDFCGYHSHFTYGSGGSAVQVKYAVFPYLNCAACSLSGKTVADMLTIVTSHEIREAVPTRATTTSTPGTTGAGTKPTTSAPGTTSTRCRTAASGCSRSSRTAAR